MQPQIGIIGMMMEDYLAKYILLLNKIDNFNSIKYWGIIGSFYNRIDFSDLDLVIIREGKINIIESIHLFYLVHKLKRKMIIDDYLQHHDIVYYGNTKLCNIPSSILNSSDVKSDVIIDYKCLINSGLENHMRGLYLLFNNIEFNDYYIKLVIASILLIPLRICNENNIICTKRKSFKIYKLYSNDSIIELVNHSERIREKWTKESIHPIHRFICTFHPTFKVSRKLRFLYKKNTLELKSEINQLINLHEKSNRI
jgi:hypothetical protein